MDIRSKETAEERRDMTKQYWNLYSSPTVESMLLSHEGKTFDEIERNEILSTLPCFRGSKVLDLGAGIGRFTSKFAATANHVTAADLMEPFIAENRRTNEHFGNITFICDDMRNLDFPDASFDLVFSNWLLIYLTNEELEVFLAKILRWLKPGGCFFFKESCFHAGGSIVRPSNPSIYRNPLEYLLLLRKINVDGSKFALKTTKNIFTLTSFQGNPYQICYLVQKTNEDVEDTEFERCIDPSLHYDDILKVFPPSMSSLLDIKGGEEFLKDVGNKTGLSEGKRVLLLGCHGEDVPKFLVENFNATLHVIVESPLLLCRAIESQGKLDCKIKKKIQYESTKWAEKSSNEKYDVILCLDMFLTKEETVNTIAKAKHCLNDGGHLASLVFIENDTCKEKGSTGFFTASELESHLKSLNFTSQIMAIETDLILKYLTSILQDLKTSQPGKDDKKATKLIEAVKKKVDLLEKKRIKLVQDIASK